MTEVARLGKQNAVAALTDVTGGRRLRFETKSKLENDLIRLGTEIHSRYLISFTPDLEKPSRFHHLQVQIKNHPDALPTPLFEYDLGIGLLPPTEINSLSKYRCAL